MHSHKRVLQFMQTHPHATSREVAGACEISHLYASQILSRLRRAGELPRPFEARGLTMHPRVSARYDRIVEYVTKHPRATSSEAGEALGCPASSMSVWLSDLRREGRLPPSPNGGRRGQYRRSWHDPEESERADAELETELQQRADDAADAGKNPAPPFSPGAEPALTLPSEGSSAEEARAVENMVAILRQMEGRLGGEAQAFSELATRVRWAASILAGEITANMFDEGGAS